MTVRKISAVRRRQLGALVSKVIHETTTPQERSESASRAAKARWAKYRAAQAAEKIREGA
jgi:hypothetical protein